MFTVLEAGYAEPARSYHTAEHIRDCLAQFDLSRSAAQRPDEVEAGIWLHDAVYQPGGADNEQRSAKLALTSLTDAGVGSEVAHRIARLVMSTQHLEVPTDPDAALLCDIDLSILGRATDVFDEFERRIRREYAWVPEPLYRGARAEILAGFLGGLPSSKPSISATSTRPRLALIWSGRSPGWPGEIGPGVSFPAPAQQLVHFVVGGLGEVLVPLADRHEWLGNMGTDDFVHFPAHRLAAFGRSDRHRHHQPGGMLCLERGHSCSHGGSCEHPSSTSITVLPWTGGGGPSPRRLARGA